MPKYRFLEPMTDEVLSNGKVRVFFNEEIVEEEIVTGEGEEQQTIVETAYYYEAVDMDANPDKGEKGFTYPELVNAFVHAHYSIDDEIALDRHARIGDRPEEVAAHDEYAESCKTWAKAYFGIE